MDNILKIIDLEEQDLENIQNVALESWIYTYKDIFDLKTIEEFNQKHYSVESLRDIIPLVLDRTASFKVAKFGDTVVGFSHFGFRDSDSRLFRIYLHPEFIGKGIGRQLLITGETFFANKSIEKYFCMVHKDNKIGRRFYEKNGFVHIPENDDGDEWYMEKTIEK